MIDNMTENKTIIDIREPYELGSGYIEGSQNIPMNILLMAPENFLDKSKTYHIICQSGARSSRTCMMLRQKGYNVINVEGGMYSYR